MSKDILVYWWNEDDVWTSTFGTIDDIADTMDFLLYRVRQRQRRKLLNNDMNKYDQVQDVVDAIEHELFIEVPKGYGVEVSNNTFQIAFDDVLDYRDLDAVEDVAFDYATSARDISTNQGSRPFVSSLTIRF